MSSGGAIKGRYEKRQVLGEGGMGVVYRAFDADLKREVALKTLRDGGDELALEMFRKECGVLASLNHPNIVDIYDVGQFEEEGAEKPYFVMPLLPGTTLDRIIKDEPQRLTVERTVEIIAQTCRGLHAAHERGLIHRDLKPSNIFVLGDDSVKIIDFGIAHLTGTHTSLGLKGTLYYMAPEQIEMKPASPQSDIYSLAVVCYEILGRRRPFTGANRDEVIRAILRSGPPPLSELNPHVTAALSQLIHAGLAKRPYNRYQTSREFADCLQKALRNQPIERFQAAKVEPRIQRVEKALADQEYEFANEVLVELEEEGQLHPAIRSLRSRLDQTLRDRTITQLMESARRRLGENEYQLALQKVQEVLQIEPRHPGALELRADIESRRSTEQIDGWVRLARQHLDNQKFGLAREALGNALAINPQDTSASSLRAEIERLEQNFSEARARKRELYDQAQEAWQRGEVTAALSKIERVIEADRQSPESGASELSSNYQTFYNRVRSEHDSLNSGYDEARKHVANGNFAAAGEICDRFLTKYPNHALFQSLRFDVGEGLRQAVSADMARVDREVEAEPDLDRRVKILEEAVALHPNETHFRQALQGVASKRDLVNSIAQKARSFEESGRFQEALSQWDILRNISPQFPGLEFEVERLKKRREQQARLDAKARWVERIDTAMNAGDHDRAMDLVASALAEFPGDAELAALEKFAKQGSERGHECEQLLASGRELRSGGNLVEAIEVLKKATDLDPRNPAARIALVDALTAQAAAQIELDCNGADAWLDQAIEIDPSHAQARSLKTLVGDKRREAGVNEALARAREFQASANVRAAYQEVLSGLAAYPLDPRLTQLKAQLSKALEELEKSALPKAVPAPPSTPVVAPSAAAKPPVVMPKGQPALPPTPPPATPPPPPRVAPPAAGKKPPLWAAALALVPLLGAAVWFLWPKASVAPVAPPITQAATVKFELTVTPSTAKVRVAGGPDFGAIRTIELAPGDYELEVYGDGIKTAKVPLKVFPGMAAPSPIVAAVEPPTVVLALSGARALLNDKLVVSGSQFLEPGEYKLKLGLGTGWGLVEFTITPGAMPVVKSAQTGGMFLTTVAVLGGKAKLFGGVKGTLGAGELVAVPPTGLDLEGLTPQPQQLRVADSVEPRAYDLAATPAPTLFFFVADPGRVDLAILSNEDGALVHVNGKPSGPIQKGQRLEQLAPGSYRIKVLKPGFVELPERTVTLSKGRPLRETFELKPLLAVFKIVGANARAQVFVDGRPAGEIKPGEAFVGSTDPGKRRIGVKADDHQSTDKEVDLRLGAETPLAFKELAVPVGFVQLSVSGANMSVSYTTGSDRPKPVTPGKITIPVGEYVFRATQPGAADQTKTVTVAFRQTSPVSFGPLPPPAAPTGSAGSSVRPGSAAPLPPSLYTDDWKPDDDWKKLDGSKSAPLPVAAGTVSFQVRRKGRFGSFIGGKPGWVYVLGNDLIRFELGSDKLTWFVTRGSDRDKKKGDAPVPKEAEDVRIEITAASIAVQVGGSGKVVTAAEAGFPDFRGGQFRFRAPISIKGLSASPAKP